MKWKKILSVCVAGAMAATLLAGCGSSDETVGEEIKDDAETVVEDVEDVAEEAAEDVKDVAEDVGEGVKDAVEDVGEDIKDAAEEAVDDVKENAGGTSFEGFDHTVTITGVGMTLYDSDGLDEVLEAVNDITVPAINVELEYTVMDMASYSEQVGLMFSGGESFDLLMMISYGAASFQVMLANNELTDITPYVDEYAPEMMELMQDYIEPFKVDGGLYGVPNYRIYNSDAYIIMRQDILDYLGLTEQAEAISSWSDLEAIFEAVSAAQDELPEELQTPCMISNCNSNGVIVAASQGQDNAADDFSEHYGYDYLGDSNGIIYVDDDGMVKCFYETQDFLDVVNRVRQWYVNDWVYKDAATNADNGDTALKNQLAFCVIETSEIGVESSKKQATGYDVLCVKSCPQVIQTSDTTAWAWGIPVTSEEPEAAVAFLNLMFTDPDIENLFVYGIEGRDYELNEDGEAVLLDDGLYQASDWMYPNQFNAYPSEGEGGDFREYSLSAMDDAEISPYLGFSINTDPISNEINSISAVITQYAPTINSGTIDASETYDEFIDALYSAGLQTFLDYYQENLDEWIAEH